jgi:VCBS repeat-containing protein
LKSVQNKLQTSTTERHNMTKTYQILVSDGSNGDIKPVRVTQGTGDKGLPVRLLVKVGWRLELQDDAKGKGLAPNQMRIKRVGKDLAIYFDQSQRADLVLEDFYASADNKPKLLGIAENGGTYEYVPQDPALSSMPSELKDDSPPVIVSLGGAPIGDAFVLSGLPIAAASGGSGWLAAGSAGAAAAAGGAGGGSGAGGTVLATPAKATGALATESDTGYSNSDGITKMTTPYYVGKAEPDKDIAITVDGNTYLGKTGSDGTYKIQLSDPPLKSGTYTPSIKVTDPATHLSTTADGTPFTVDTSGAPDTNQNPEVKIGAISDDTGEQTNDFITSDNTLAYEGRVSGVAANAARLRLELKDNAGSVLKTEDVAFSDAGIWTWNDPSTPRADGKYTLVATLVDVAGNAMTGAKASASQTVIISANGFTAVNDTGIAKEEGGVNNATTGSTATGNVLSNDTTVDTVVTKKVAPLVNIAGAYGWLTLSEDGSYTYAVNNANATVNSLRDFTANPSETLTDTFVYTATDSTGKSKEATLAITIQGANDTPVFSGFSAFDVLKTDSVVSNPVSLKVADPDGDGAESKFSVPEVRAGKYGAFTFSASDQTWAYQVDKDSPAVGTVDSHSEFHDLLTVTSLDGSAYRTLDVRVKDGEGVNLPKIMNLLNVEGVTAVGNLTISDSVILLGLREIFDLVSPTTNIAHVEKIDITGSGDNIIKLNLASLTQADVDEGAHKLWIDGDAADVVQFDGYTAATQPRSVQVAGISYNRYIFDATHELLINAAIAPLAV